MKAPNGRAEIEALFGNPANQDGTLNEAWESQNIRKAAPPDSNSVLIPARSRGLLRLTAELVDVEFEAAGTNVSPMRGLFPGVAAGKNLIVTSRIGVDQYVFISVRNDTQEAFQVRTDGDTDNRPVAFLPPTSVVHLGYVLLDSVESLVLVPTRGYDHALAWSLREGGESSVRTLIDPETGFLEIACREEYLN